MRDIQYWSVEQTKTLDTEAPTEWSVCQSEGVSIGELVRFYPNTFLTKALTSVLLIQYNGHLSVNVDFGFGSIKPSTLNAGPAL